MADKHTGDLYDVFFSHATPDKPSTEPLYAALVARGLRVFRDDREIDELTPDIAGALRDALARSRLVLCWVTDEWCRRPACQAELRAGLVAAASEGAGLMKRVALVLPGADVDARRKGLAQMFRLGRVPGLEVGNSDAVGIIAERVRQRALDAGCAIGARTRVDVSWPLGRPASAERFVGREAMIWDVHSALLGEDAALAGGRAGDAVCLQGLGGIGKSLLAAEYARQFQGCYPGGVFWMSGAEDDLGGAVRQALIAMGEPLDLPEGVRGGTLEEQRFHRDLLGRVLDGRGRCLWVVDDVPAERAKVWRCPGSLGRTLATSRTPLPAHAGFGLIRVEELDEDSGLQLLRRWSLAAECSEADGRELVRRLGGHPLALDVAGALVAGSGLTVRGLLEEVEKRGELLALEAERHGYLPDELRDQLPNGHEPSILATLRLSWERLGDGDPVRQREAQLVLRVCAELAQAPVPDMLLHVALGVVRSDSDKAAEEIIASAVAPLLPGPAPATRVGAADAAIRALARAGLLSGPRLFRLMAGDPEVRVVDVHQLVRSAAEQLWQPDDSLRLAQGAMYDLMARALEPVAEDPRHVGAGRSLHTHALHLIDPPEEICGDLRTLVATVRSALGDHDGARVVLEDVLAVRRRMLGPEHPDTLLTMCNLGNTMYAQGDPAGAQAVEEEWLVGLRRTLGPEHRYTLLALNNLAVSRLAQGEDVWPLAAFEEVLAARRRTLGLEDSQTLSAMQNIAMVMAAQGSHVAAQAVFREVLAMRRRTLGLAHPDTLRTQALLVASIAVLGDKAGTRPMEEEELAILRRTLGPEHSYTLRAMGKLTGTPEVLGEVAIDAELTELARRLREGPG